jgi:hypothetical protein
MSDAVVQGPGFATATTRDQTHALLGQAMGLVAATAGFTALGAYVAQHDRRRHAAPVHRSSSGMRRKASSWRRPKRWLGYWETEHD